MLDVHRGDPEALRQRRHLVPVHTGRDGLWVLAALAIEMQAPSDVVQDQVDPTQVDDDAERSEDDLCAAGCDEQEGLSINSALLPRHAFSAEPGGRPRAYKVDKHRDEDGQGLQELRLPELAQL